MWKHTPGKQLLIEHLHLAVAKNLPVRMVVATLEDPRERTNNDASALRKTFAIYRNMVAMSWNTTVISSQSIFIRYDAVDCGNPMSADILRVER
jgi:hypothetical protein